MNEYIKLENITKTIKKRIVLDNINLSIIKGNVCGLIGRNGSGKTMLIRVISGLITPDCGNVIVGGKIISRNHSFPDSMGLMIEKIDLWPDLSAMENLTMIAEIRNVIGSKEIRTALERVGLDPDDKRKTKAYSLGMKQKLVIAQAIMESPELLLMDEPTNGLDDESVALFQKIIKEEKEKGTTVVIATHQKEDIRDICDCYYRLFDGKCEITEGGIHEN